MMWWIRNAIVAILTFTLKIHQLHNNWHSIDIVQFKFHPNYKMEISFSFSFSWKFWPIFLFSNTFFSFFQPKKLGQNHECFFFLGVEIQQFFPFCWKFSPIFWYHNFLKEKNHPFTTTFFYLHTLINSTLLYSNWKKAFLLARDILFSFQNKRIQFTWEKNCNYYYLPMLCFALVFSFCWARFTNTSIPLTPMIWSSDK